MQDTKGSGIHFLDSSFSPPKLREAAKCFRAALEPVGLLHSLGTAHPSRDLKPANMLIDKNNAITLADGGMAVFPTSLLRPAPSSAVSPSTPAIKVLASAKLA